MLKEINIEKTKVVVFGRKEKNREMGTVWEGNKTYE